MSTWFTSDLHLGHTLMVGTRCFKNMAEHDWTLIENINKLVSKHDKLFILGDLAFTTDALKNVSIIRCRNIELILGNHDKFPIHKYLDVVQKVHGFRSYKGFWLSHCPIHPSEMRDMKGNLHGHIHIFSDTPRISDKRYFCANTEFHGLSPISFEDIEKVLENRNENFSFYTGSNVIE